MKSRFSFLFLLVLLLGSACSTQNEFYVSPEGNDSGPGKKSRPFATIEKARAAVRETLGNSSIAEITIWLSDGTYPLKSPVVFTAADFPGSNTIINYRALPGQHPVISGGLELKGWTKGTNGIWETSLPETYRQAPPRELFINGIRATRARTPNEGFLRVNKAGEDHRTSFYYEPGDFTVPADPENVEIVLLHDWSISRIKIQEIDADQGEITAVDSIGARSPSFFTIDHWEQHPRYFLENSLSFLDSENEWFCDRADKKLYLKLSPQADPEECSIIIPVSEGLIQLAGTADKPVNNLRFQGISFTHSAWYPPEQGYSGIQATHFDPRPESREWTVVESAVKAEWARNCAFINCRFSNLGGSGIWFSTGSSNCLVKDSIFTDISGNGLMIGEGRDRLVNGDSWWSSAPEQAATGNRIENCTITECGRQFFGAVGIWCGLAANTTIVGNEIARLPYTGISVGWMWNATPTPCRENVIGGNHIHHILEVLSDGGGIYMLGLQPGSRLINNRIHDVKINAGRAESNGMFLDEGSTDLVIADNLIYNIAKSPLRFHKATANLVKDNSLFCSGDNPPVRYNSTLEEDIKMEGNLILNESDKEYREKLEETIAGWKILKGKRLIDKGCE